MYGRGRKQSVMSLWILFFSAVENLRQFQGHYDPNLSRSSMLRCKYCSQLRGTKVKTEHEGTR